MENLQGLSPQNQNASAEEESKRKAAEDEMRRDMMATILDSAARERCTCSFLFLA
jgi:programmed cell death protein 5